KLQNDGIGLAAIDTGVLDQVGEHARREFSARDGPTLALRTNWPIDQLGVPARGDSALTRQTDALADASTHGAERELGERLLRATYAALPPERCCLQIQLYPGAPTNWCARTPQRAAGRGSTMAVHAPDIALIDLLQDGRPRPSGVRVVRDVGDLLAAVIELEHDDVRLTTIHAGMRE